MQQFRSIFVLFTLFCYLSNNKKRLSNKFWAVSFYSFNRLKNKLKNKAFMLKFSVKAFVMS